MSKGERPGRGERLLAIGLMSGTSMDGVDAALIETDGVHAVRPLAATHLPYDAATGARLRAAQAIGLAAAAPHDHADLAETTRHLTMLHAEAVGQLMAAAGVAAAQVDVIGFHGQTVAHRPDRRWTWQIGDGAQLAAMTGITVVNDFRSADVAAGGQGAPLVPLFHAALARQAGLPLPLVIANIGGVANVTWIGAADGDLLAFDTGPGNALIDDWMRQNSGETMDAGGRAGLAGRVHDQLVDQMLDHPWFAARPPKSLDRNDFDPAALRGLSLADGAATLAALTARALALAAGHFPEPAPNWIVAGGGRHNAAIMKRLAEALGLSPDTADSFGWDGDALEAQAFAYLAVRSLKGLPLSLPGTTGVPAPQTGGELHVPPRSS